MDLTALQTWFASLPQEEQTKVRINNLALSSGPSGTSSPRDTFTHRLPHAIHHHDLSNARETHLSHLQADLDDILHSLNSALSQTASPLLTLQRTLEILTRFGPQMASFLFSSLFSTSGAIFPQLAGKGDFERVLVVVQMGLRRKWEVWKGEAWDFLHLSTLVALLVVPAEELDGIVKGTFERRSVGEMRGTRSMSVLESFRIAMKMALGEEGKTTVMLVELCDVHHTELELGSCIPHYSFETGFVLGVGPEGCIMWQSREKNSYTLDEYIEAGLAEVRSFEEVEAWLEEFDAFAKVKSREGKWNFKRNEAYKRLFGVDINEVCFPRGSESRITPRFEPWVRVKLLPDVKTADIIKFLWL